MIQFVLQSSSYLRSKLILDSCNILMIFTIYVVSFCVYLIDSPHRISTLQAISTSENIQWHCS